MDMRQADSEKGDDAMDVSTENIDGPAADARYNASGQSEGSELSARPLRFTKHARRRSSRRNVEPNAVDYVLAHGRMLHRTGAVFFFLGRRDVPRGDRGQSWAARLEGTIVVVAQDGVVITVYRNRQGSRAIQRKLKYRLTDRCEQPLDTLLDGDEDEVNEPATA